MFTGVCGQPDLLAFAKQRIANVHHQLFGNAWTPPHPGPAHRLDTTYDDIPYRLEACEDHAALGGQVIGVGANPDTMQTLVM
jgi:hypothetical protein